MRKVKNEILLQSRDGVVSVLTGLRNDPGYESQKGMGFFYPSNLPDML
jgi:hypothetical protein